MKKWYEVDMNNSKNYGCYNKQMKADLKEMYKSYSENGNGITPPPAPDCDAIFCDNFETGWFNNNIFISKYSENFDSVWFDSNNYIDTYEDEFEDNWFTINNFINIWDEYFEDVSWDE